MRDFVSRRSTLFLATADGLGAGPAVERAQRGRRGVPRLVPAGRDV